MGQHTFQLDYWSAPKTGNDYKIPALKTVSDQAGVVQQGWIYTTGPQGEGNIYKTFYTHNGKNGGFDINTMASFRPNQQYDISNKNIYIHKNSLTEEKLNFSSANFSITSNGEFSTVQATGFPCLQYNGKPIARLETNFLYGYISAINDYNGNRTTFEYDTKGRLKKITEAVNDAIKKRETIYTYDTAFNVPSTITAPNITITNSIDGYGRIYVQTKTSTLAGSQSKTTTYEYYNDNPDTSRSFGLLKKYDGPRTDIDDTITYTYDDYGHVAEIKYAVLTAASATPTTYSKKFTEYNSSGAPKFTFFENGQVQQTLFNTSNQPISVTIGVLNGTTVTGLTTINDYDEVTKLLKSTTDEDGLVTTYAYYPNHKLKEIEYPNGNTVTIDYNALGGEASRTYKNANGVQSGVTSTTLDANGRALRNQVGNDSSKQWTEYAYDLNGNTKTITTPSPTGSGNAVDTYTYDALNRVETHKNPLNYTTTNAYDSADNPKSVTLPNSSGSTRTFKDHHILDTETLSDYAAQSTKTDLADNVTQAVHGVRTCHHTPYDQLNRSQRMACSDSTVNATNQPLYNIDDQYSYDTTRFGRLDSVTSNTASSKSHSNTSYGYDNFDRITSKSQKINYTTSTALSVGYGYSPSGRLASITYPSGKTIDYVYHSTNGDLVGLNLNSSALISGLTYDGSDRITGWRFGNIGSYSAGSMTYGYNALDQLNLVQHKNNAGANLLSLSYTFNADGSIKTQTLNNSSPVFSYGYDAAGQLTSESGAGYAISYSYDSNGNRTSLTASGASNPLGYTAATTPIQTNKNRLASYSTTLNATTTNHSLTHLPAGELRLDTLLGSAGYDSIGQRRYESASPNGVYATRWMEYNHKNERTLIWGGNSSTTVNGVTTTSTLTRQFMYDEASHLIGEYNRDGTVIVEYVWLGDRPVATLYPNGRIVYLITDHQNKPRRGYDAALGRYVWSWDADAFGVKAATAEAGVVQNLRFPGQVYDVATGLHYNHNRFYNPKLGRYMEPDPIKLAGGNNPYAYVGNDPVNNVDPSGLFFSPNDNYAINDYANFDSGYLNGLQLSFENASSNYLNLGGYGNLQASTSIVIQGVRGGAIAGAEIGASLGGPWGAAGGAIIGGSIGGLGGLWLGDAIFNESSESNGTPDSSQRPSKTPNTGAPGSTHINPGSGQERKYGADGFPVQDIDHDHDHGQGRPHVHDWGRDANGRPVRGPGRPYRPN